jgi:hypothetical protein
MSSLGPSTPPTPPTLATPPRAPAGVLLRHLWPDGDDERVFAILDGARDPRIHPAVTRSGLAHHCLYSGTLEPVLARAAPYLVQLRREAPLARELVTRWGDAWGIYLRSSAGLSALHRHFRRFLRVKDENGKNLIFRYYDPRVLRPYLPTCTEAELDYVFGPVQRFIHEADGGAAAVAHHREGGRLVTEDLSVVRRESFIEGYLRREGMLGGNEK